MNERIVKLITEADAYAWTISEKYVPECGEVNYLWEDAFRKKFAELIVRECAEIAFQFSMENKRIHPKVDPTTMPEANQMVYHSTCQAVGYEIREHFGVEE